MSNIAKKEKKKKGFSSTALFAQNTTCFQKHVYAFVDFLGSCWLSALKVRKLLLKFLKNSRYRIGPSLSPLLKNHLNFQREDPN
jgi:hypothetical protein